jgi:hypothetical protein
LKELDKRIESLLAKCEAEDATEDRDPSSVSMDEEIVKNKQLKERVEELVKKMEERSEDKINSTDEDSAIMRSVQGSHSSYNVQQVVEDKNGLIVHAEPVRDTSDVNQFAHQISEAQKTLGQKCEIACGDAGYADTKELGKVDSEGIRVIVPSQRQALHKGVKQFDKSAFQYDAEADCYWCPKGKQLLFKWWDRDRNRKYYRPDLAVSCIECEYFGQCTSSKKYGRTIMRLDQEDLKNKLEAEYESEQSQEIYARRKKRVELPFGHWKRNLKLDAFLLRGLDGASAETSLVATCFNIVRMINLVGGVEALRQRLAGLPAQY